MTSAKESRFEDPAKEADDTKKKGPEPFKPFWAIIEREDEPGRAPGIGEGRARMIYSTNFLERRDLDAWLAAHVDEGFDNVLVYERVLKPGGAGFTDKLLTEPEEIFPADEGRRNLVIAEAHRALVEGAAVARTSFRPTVKTAADEVEERRARLKAEGERIKREGLSGE